MGTDDRNNGAGAGGAPSGKAPGTGERAGHSDRVHVPETEIGTEADLGVPDDPADGGIGQEEDLGLLADSSTAPSEAGSEAVAPLDLKGALPLYKFPGFGEGKEQRPKTAVRARPPSGDLKGAGPPADGKARVHVDRHPTGPTSVRRERYVDRVAEHKTLIIVVVAVVAAILIALVVMKAADSHRREASEAERLQNLSQQK